MQFQAQWMEIDMGQNKTLNVGVSWKIDNKCFELIDPLTTEKLHIAIANFK